jgi:hypothetical protein
MMLAELGWLDLVGWSHHPSFGKKRENKGGQEGKAHSLIYGINLLNLPMAAGDCFHFIYQLI